MVIWSAKGANSEKKLRFEIRALEVLEWAKTSRNRADYSSQPARRTRDCRPDSY